MGNTSVNNTIVWGPGAALLIFYYQVSGPIMMLGLVNSPEEPRQGPQGSELEPLNVLRVDH